MAVSVLQSAANDDGLVGASGTTVAVTITVTAGSVLFVCVHYEDGGALTVSVSDSVNGTYGAAVNSANDASFGRKVSTFQFTNAAAGSTTITATFSGSVQARAIAVMEIGGAKTSGALDGNSALNQSDPGTTDGITSGSASNSNQPALVAAWCVNVQNGSAETAGTGFTTQLAAGWPNQPGTGFPTSVIGESKRITATGSQSATFTGGSFEDYSALMAIFDEAPPGSGSASVSWLKA